MKKLLSLAAFAIIVTTVAAAHQDSAEIRRRSNVERYAELMRKGNKMMGEAHRLILLNINISQAESLLLEAATFLEPGSESPQEMLAELYEGQGRIEEARLIYRPIIFPRRGITTGDSRSPQHLMRYALLCRQVGKLDEERVVLDKMPQPTLFEKLVAAAKEAESTGSRTLAIAFYSEALRLRPSDQRTAARLARARKDYASWRILEIERVKKESVATGP